jgi:hypothetical protein
MTAQRILRNACLVTAVLGAVACSTPSTVLSGARFRNQEPVWRVNDRKDVPVKPRRRATPSMTAAMESLFFRRIGRALEAPSPRRARNINSLGEVPDSTWFENRIGRGDLTPEQVGRGPNRGPGPQPPFTIYEDKLAGKSIGFFVRDRLGERYVIKLEDRCAHRYETSADVVVQRLLWAAGYHVPENTVLTIRKSDLILTRSAVTRDEYGNSVRLRRSRVENKLADAHRLPGNRYRILASKHVPGENLGGWPQEGRRKSDPNDTVWHQHRRELRGLYVFLAWVQSTDMKEGNTVDAWVEDADRPGRHFVMHYLVDFGKSLGNFVDLSQRPADGHARAFDLEVFTRGLVSFGLWRRPWEGSYRPGLPGIATFDAAHFNPGGFEQQLPYAPFLFKDDYDMLWASRILARFSRAHIRAAVAAGYSDPDAIAYLTDILVARRDKTLAHWLPRVNAVDQFEARGSGPRFELCFADLVRAHLLSHPRARFRLRTYDYAGRPLGTDVRSPGSSGARQCVAGLKMGRAKAGYTIVRIDTRRGKRRHRPLEVHLARNPAGGQLRVIGVMR